MTDETTPPTPQRPHKRWRKTKWFYGIIFVYLAVTVVAAISWSAYSHRKFSEAVDPIIARGEPLAWSDFATDPIPDDQNAAVLYEGLMAGPPLQDTNGEFYSDAEPWSWGRYEIVDKFMSWRENRQKHPEELRKLLEMASDVFAACRKARHLDGCHWRIDFSGKPHEVEIPQYQAFVEIANLLSLAAMEAHEAGRDDDAIEYYLDGIAMGDSMFKAPMLVSYLVGLAVHAIMDATLEDILPEIKIGDAPGCVSRDKLRKLISRLLDTSRLTEGLTLAMISERSMSYEFCRIVLNYEFMSLRTTPGMSGKHLTEISGSSPVARSGFDFFLAPLFRIDAAWLVEHNGAYIDASKAATLPQSRRQLHQPALDLDKRLARMWCSRPLSGILAPVSEGAIEIHYRLLATRTMAYTATAIRLYEVDRGSRPSKLGDLVPDYLTEIPQDPMDEPGKKIRYANKPDMPRLYSVGRDGQDDGGAYDDLYQSAANQKEVLFFLTGRPEPPKEESDPDVSDDG